MTDNRDIAEEPPIPDYSWSEFLTTIPPGTMANIPDVVGVISIPARTIATPDLVFYCSSENCRGERIFSATAQPSAAPGRWKYLFLTYSCRNCTQQTKTFALLIHPSEANGNTGVSIKIGEWPSFGPPVPARVISMVGPDRDLFLKGRRAENQGLGLGAFAYYRRVVEEQKDRLLGEVIRVARKVGAKPETIIALESAVAEQQFSLSLELTKGAIPESLLVNGHNPLLLLHRALSAGLHAGTDDECLAIARSIRVVLTELAERISQALKDTAELQDAITQLMSAPIKSKPTSRGAG